MDHEENKVTLSTVYSQFIHGPWLCIPGSTHDLFFLVSRKKRTYLTGSVSPVLQLYYVPKPKQTQTVPGIKGTYCTEYT